MAKDPLKLMPNLDMDMAMDMDTDMVLDTVVATLTLEVITMERGQLMPNLDTTAMDTAMVVMPVTMVVALHMLDVPFGVWVNDQLMLNPRLKLMLNLDMDMAMDMDMVVMVIMVMVMVMVMATVTTVRSFRKILHIHAA